jgi:hypothetical protein
MKNYELILVAAAAVLTIPVCILLNEWAGVYLVYLTFIILLSSAEFRRDRRLMMVGIVTLAARHAVSLTNAYHSTIYGADLDAYTFHLRAQDVASSVAGGWREEFNFFGDGATTYVFFIALFYRLLGDSLLVGQTLSVLAYVLSCLLLVKLAGLLGLARYKVPILLVYGLLPTTVLYGSITMRESYQMLFFLGVAYWAVRLKRQVSAWNLAWLGLSAIGLGLLHNGLITYAPFLVGFAIVWAMGGGGLMGFLKEGKVPAMQAVAALLVMTVAFIWLALAREGVGAAKALVEGEAAEYAGVYREHGDQDSRANYDVKLDTSSPLGFLATAPLVFIYYMFAPFPWQISSVLDIYATFETILRSLLIYHALAAWRRSSGLQRSQYFFLLCCFFSLELLWSLGTANWGTATRHHVVAYAVIVAAGGAGLARQVMEPLRRLTGRIRTPVAPRRVPIRRPLPARLSPRSE